MTFPLSCPCLGLSFALAFALTFAATLARRGWELVVPKVIKRSGMRGSDVLAALSFDRANHDGVEVIQTSIWMVGLVVKPIVVGNILL